MYLLDTNVWIVHLRSKRNAKLSQRLLSTPGSQIATCSVVRAELITGALKSSKPSVDLAETELLLAPFHSFAFDDVAAKIYAEIRTSLESKGMGIGSNDYMIAAIALVNNLTLVTHNIGEFSRVPNLRVEDWQ